MYRTIKRMRLLALITMMTVLLSTVSVAFAARVPVSVEDAKDELELVQIAQTYNAAPNNSATHDYTTDGDEVNIKYTATLKMTEEMAIYLQARQSQLLNAKFNVHVKMDMDKLEFTDADNTLTVAFSSSFLKPWDVDSDDMRQYPDAFSDYKEGAYSSEFVKYDSNTGLYHYNIFVEKSWAQDFAEKHGYIDVPMELIVYCDGANTYSYEDLPAKAASEKPMFYNYSEADWMKEIKATVAEVRVKDSVRDSVTSSNSVWIYASGTIDGEFTYERSHKIETINDYKYANNTNVLEYGNVDTEEEWKSNTVSVRLIRSTPYVPPTPGPDPTPGGGDGPDSPYLNLEDHFAYIIGYPDGLVHPEGTITRAEVATIFFRMLTDEVRDEYWSKTNPYNDVKLTDWFNNAISTLTNLGVLTGYPDGGFHPQANITRAEFATMAVRFFIITEEYTKYEGDAFSDIADHWANEYINIAYLLDIIDGYPDGTYRPQNAITRAEAMTIVNNTLRRAPCVPGIEPVEDHEDFITWPDNMNKKIWYYPAVQEATNSHDYVRTVDLEGKELWLDILPVRDWAAFERAWSDANSAANPGEVVDGK